MHDLTTTRRFVHISQIRHQCRAAIESRTLSAATSSKVGISLREIVDQLLRSSLQISIAGLRHAEACPVRVNDLTVVLAVTTFRSEPNGVVLIDLTPVSRHAHLYAAVEDRVVLITRRWILDASARPIIVGRVGVLASRITLSAARYLLH